MKKHFLIILNNGKKEVKFVVLADNYQNAFNSLTAKQKQNVLSIVEI